MDLWNGQLNFITMDPKAPIAITTSQSLKHWWVQKHTTWNTCRCQYHQEWKELLGGLNNFRACGAGLNKTCTCNCSEVCSLPLECTESNVHSTKYMMHTKRPIVVLLSFGHFVVYIHSPKIPSGTTEGAFLENVYIVVSTS